MRPIRLALICDYLEEAWPSMDLVGEMIEDRLRREHGAEIEVTRICPPFRPRARGLPLVRSRGVARQADLFLNRFVDYPRVARELARRGTFDVFHLVDHSYSQLVHDLPAEKTVVTCHDLDTFRSLLAPELEPRPAWFRAMMRRTLSGLRRAGGVACDSEATRAGILKHSLVPDERLRIVHLGTHPECTPEADAAADARVVGLLGPADPDGPVNLLHVGSNIARKRIDVLLGTFAGVRRAVPRARLVKVGGALTEEQTRLARELGVLDAMVTLPFFSPRESKDRAALAAVYRRASLVLQPSDAEGFGLPMAEAIACGVPLLASDLPVLREVAGEAAVYAPVGDVAAWTERALGVLEDRRVASDAWRRRRSIGVDRARMFRWSTHVDHLVEMYRALHEKRPAGRANS